MFIVSLIDLSDLPFSFLFQLHEASFFALGSLSEQLCEAQVGF